MITFQAKAGARFETQGRRSTLSRISLWRQHRHGPTVAFKYRAPISVEPYPVSVKAGARSNHPIAFANQPIA
ncbi:MAG: hypothetical protein QNI89_10960 [Desulfobacterales bacterium]|nr:hypothetical protein [Desulfobacterales bacterium]